MTSGMGGEPIPELPACGGMKWAGNALAIDAGAGARALGLVVLDDGRLGFVFCSSADRMRRSIWSERSSPTSRKRSGIA